ncbi:DUF4166 domain-containing protein [Halomicrobium salinisoli]|uniref:DUF4166 domain-containing protein n=1 Tax=Halomicrobium salinisoli TaxID=2878391 RepID=UPI001CF00FA1|nr:DUF4166 domain-containing protein [Halomicrobium salinisoli]
MTGVYERALGDAAEDLHPEVRDRYALGPDDDVATVGRGRMDIERGTLALPALYPMPVRNLLFPETGRDVPFSVTTAAWRDEAGHEALTTRREFEFDEQTRRFDSVTVWDAEAERLLDFLGTGGHVVSELHPRVEDGALVVESGRQWARIGGRYVRTPGPMAVDVEVRDRYVESEGHFRVDATVDSTLVGRVLSYRGTFTQEEREMESVPADLRPTSGLRTLPPR